MNKIGTTQVIPVGIDKRFKHDLTESQNFENTFVRSQKITCKPSLWCSEKVFRPIEQDNGSEQAEYNQMIFSSAVAKVPHLRSVPKRCISPTDQMERFVTYNLLKDSFRYNSNFTE